MGETFVVNRLDLKKMLTMLGMSDKNIDTLEASINKMHRHVDAVTFAGMLQKYGLGAESTKNVLRRLGIDDVTITKILNALDEERISSSYGRVVEVNVI
jgi:ribosomal protein S13